MHKLVRILSIGLAVIFIWGCQPSKTLLSDSESAAPDSLEYSLVYLIHGDGGYLYHDEKGTGREADQEKVKEAIEIARQAKKGEVFIFHQRPEKKLLWLFPQKDRRMYHFRGGELVQKKKYSPMNDDSSFTAEAKLYNQFKSNTKRKILSYFGHEIPPEDMGYHASRKEASFNIDTFSDGVASFLYQEETFDLTILSTCDNGTPVMASRLADYTNIMLASPKNLHLSHIDTDSLLKLEENTVISEGELAKSIAANTFQRLNEFIQTEVTLSVYDFREIKADLSAFEAAYKEYRRKSSDEDKEPGGSLEIQNTDCAALPFWNSSTAPKVTAVYHRPARFGRQTNSDTFSGWGCE